MESDWNEEEKQNELRNVNENWRKGRLKELTQIHTLT